MRFSRALRLSVVPVLGLAAMAAAQEPTARERAVAIDAVPIPSPDDPALHVIAEGLRLPWSMAFLPGGGILVTEKHAGVRLIGGDGKAGPLLTGGPKRVLAHEDSGYLDIAPDPDFDANRTVYIAFAEGVEASNRTAIWRGRFDGTRFTDGKVIFRGNVAKKGYSHPGGRMVFLPDKTLLLTVGDGYDYKAAAQDMGSHLGKVLRLTRTGAAAPDNPFAGRAGVAPEIWTSGHRNIQGLALDPVTGGVWSHEHGPRGGDEINLLRAGANYGWPKVSYGIDYDGSLITELQAAPDYERPRFFWAPSIAPSGLTVYRGDHYPDLSGKFLVGGLASRSLVRVRPGKDTGLLIEDRRMYATLGARIRDVRTGPDGMVYLLTDDAQDGKLLRIASATAAKSAAPGRSTHDLDFWIGRWEGEASFKPAFTPGAQPRPETVRVACEPILVGNYVQCVLVLTRPDGRKREVMWLWNFNEVSGSYEGITLASNYGEETAFRIRWNESEKAWIGLIPAKTADGRAATERLVFQPSEDRASIIGLEMIRPNDPPAADWVRTFEFRLRRVPA